MKKTQAEIFGKTQHIWKNRAETEKKSKEVEKVETEGETESKDQREITGKEGPTRGSLVFSA